MEKRLFLIHIKRQWILEAGLLLRMMNLLVDNATTHTKTHLDVRMFCKNTNKSCPVEQLKWMVNGEEID